MLDTVGIDISKGTFDAYWLGVERHQKFSNDAAGLRRFNDWLRRTEASLVIFEATGVYGRLLEHWLAENGIPFSRINPRQARRFAEGIGQIAKTDKVDAAILARMGSLLEMEAQDPRSQTQDSLKELAAARQALLKDRTAAKARLETASLALLRSQFKRRLTQIERDLASGSTSTFRSRNADPHH